MNYYDKWSTEALLDWIVQYQENDLLRSPESNQIYKEMMEALYRKIFTKI